MAVTNTLVFNNGILPAPSERLSLNCIQIISTDTETGIQELIAGVTSEFHKIYALQLFGIQNGSNINFYSNTTEILQLNVTQGDNLFIKYYPLYLRTAQGEAFQFNKINSSMDLEMNIWYSTGTRT